MFAATGEKDEALAIRKNGAVYSLLGMKDEAIQYIEDEMKKDYEHHDCSYISLLNSPFYDSLRDDTRFHEILKKAKQKYEERLKKFADLWWLERCWPRASWGGGCEGEGGGAEAAVANSSYPIDSPH